MSKDTPKQISVPPTSVDMDAKGTPDTELVLSVLTDLNIARKSTLLYPLDHDQVKQSSLRAISRLKYLFADMPAIKIGIAANTLVIEGKTLDPKIPVCKELAISFAKCDIVMLIISRGLTAAEIAVFFSILARNPDQIQTQVELINTLKNNCVSHIQVTLVDYKRFKITDEAKINRTKADDNVKAPENIWHKFANQLMDDPMKRPQDTVSPEQIARLLNRQPEKAQSLLREYERSLGNHLQQNKSVQSEPAQSDVVADLDILLHGLNPKLRHQFLASTLRQCDQSYQSSPQTYEFMSQLSHDIIAEMLEYANQAESGISKSLLHLIEKIGPLAGGDHTLESPGKAPQSKEPQMEDYQELFKQEDYDKYVTEEYSDTLRRLSASSPSDACPETSRSEPPYPEKFNMDPSQLNQHLIRALKGLMDHCDLADEYSAYSSKAVEIAKECFQHKQFDIAFEAIETLKHHTKTKQSNEIIQTAQSALKQLTDSEIINELMLVLGQSKSTLPPAIAPLLEAIGPRIIPPLVEIFMQGGGGEKQHLILTILNRYKKESVAAAHQSVQRNDIDQIKKMIFLIRKINDRASSAYLRSLVAHTNPEISAEALAALLYFNDHWGIFFLRNRLNSENLEETAQAIHLAGDYRIKEMVPDLSQRLKFNALSKADIRRNADLVTALGKIGDPAAIPFLTKLIQNAWSLYRSNLKELKINTFKSLKGYPLHDIAPLLKLGRQQKNDTIRQICRQLSSP